MKILIAASLIFLTFTVFKKPEGEFREKLNLLNHEVISNIEGAVIRIKLDLERKTRDFLYASDGWQKITGYSINEVKHSNYMENFLCKEEFDNTLESYYDQVKNGNIYRLEYRLQRKDGKIIWVQETGKVLRRVGKLYFNQSIMTDITKSKQQQQEIVLNENLFRIATTLSRGIISEYDMIENRYSRFLNGETLFGLTFEDVTRDMAGCKNLSFEETEDMIIRYFYYKDDFDTVKAAFKTLYEKGDVEFEARVNGIDGVPIWCRAHIVSVKDEEGNFIRRICLMQDIDDLKRETEKLLSQANQDPLTGLFNKIAVTQLIEKNLKNATYQKAALLIIDIDDFKSINDTLGHLFGDAVLINVSAKLKKLFRVSGALIGRIGGDEFLIFIPDASEKSATAKAGEICDSLAKSYFGDKGNYKVSCSVGIAMAEEGDCYETLFQKADVALYTVKDNGKMQYHLFDSATDSHIMRADRKLRTAIDMSYTSQNLDIKEQFFGLIYSAQDLKTNINMILSLLGRKFDVSRVYIFENYEGNQFTRNSFEWCNDGISAEIDNLQRVDVGEEVEYFKLFNNNDVFNCESVEEIADDGIKTVLLSQGISSVLQVLIKEHNEIKGFIGFDVCTGRRVWRADELDILVYAARIIGTFVLKKRAEKNLLQEDTNKKEILDNLPDAIYVIDDAFNLLYINKQAHKYAPDCKVGQKCYSAFFNRDEKCENCSAIKLCDGQTQTSECSHGNLKIGAVVTASKIRWGGSNMATLVSYKKISEKNKNIEKKRKMNNKE